MIKEQKHQLQKQDTTSVDSENLRAAEIVVQNSKWGKGQRASGDQLSQQHLSPVHSNHLPYTQQIHSILALSPTATSKPLSESTPQCSNMCRWTDHSCAEKGIRLKLEGAEGSFKHAGPFVWWDVTWCSNLAEAQQVWPCGRGPSCIPDIWFSMNTAFLSFFFPSLFRFFKLHERKCEPIIMTVPRKVSPGISFSVM